MGLNLVGDDWRARFGEFQTETPPLTRIDGHALNSSCEIIGLSLDWNEATGVYNPPGHFLVASLTPTPILSCCYGGGSRKAYRMAGDVMWLPPEADLQCRWSKGTQKTVACLIDFDRIVESLDIEWQWRQADFRAGLDVRNPYVSIALRRLAEEAEAPGFASDLQIQCTLAFLVLELRRHFEGRRDVVGKERGKLSRAQITKLRDMVEESDAEMPSLSSMAKAVHVSTRQLSAMFRASMGCTLRSYVAQARVRKAQTLLLDPRLLTKQVAFRSGFRDPASFAAAFRRSTGVTPSEYRELNLIDVVDDLDPPTLM